MFLYRVILCVTKFEIIVILEYRDTRKTFVLCCFNRCILVSKVFNNKVPSFILIQTFYLKLCSYDNQMLLFKTNWNIMFVLGDDEYRERLKGKIRECLFFYVEIF